MAVHCTGQSQLDQWADGPGHGPWQGVRTRDRFDLDAERNMASDFISVSGQWEL